MINETLDKFHLFSTIPVPACGVTCTSGMESKGIKLFDNIWQAYFSSFHLQLKLIQVYELAKYFIQIYIII